jgi:hypothetical protein
MVKRQAFEIGLVMRGGEARVVDVGAPATLVWLSDTYPHAQMDESALANYALAARLAHHVVAPEEPFEQWIERVEYLSGDDDDVAELREEIAASNGSPTPAAAEEALPTAAEEAVRVSG